MAFLIARRTLPLQRRVFKAALRIAFIHFFAKAFCGADDGINETTFDAKFGCHLRPSQGHCMPVNRSLKPFRRMARRTCSQWTPPQRTLDAVTGLPVLALGEESREAVIDRARRLAADPSYPSPYVIDEVAELIARHVRI
jgi:hypothetical protein